MITGIADMVYNGETLRTAVIEFADQIERLFPIEGLGYNVQRLIVRLWPDDIDDSWHICLTPNDPLPCDEIGYDTSNIAYSENDNVIYIFRPTYVLTIQGTTIVQINLMSDVYGLPCDSLDLDPEHALYPCILSGQNDTIPNFLDYIARYGDAKPIREPSKDMSNI